ncbi:hypothetical protein GGTG_01128 [Gaeumannomyces tritici R3-111a-1]|uniref:Peptidase S33 tripeptidyl aminopeptidase-like C-terminal domain-containing protein n=1 Tax=Gaeumannomyces tritici (strain R3-111a-1) TaxID=644352 RepID=J3NIP5_GAET3|nr:hypothetical protein GGTG_01128 [Gaeumannomyces tritici R3-111a-1]EJT81144.1 hypothetical protein GGTG_01128 [Gaeumannomyces tritici R3-111a-1]
MPRLTTFATALAAAASAASSPVSGIGSESGFVQGRTEGKISWGPCPPELKLNASNPAVVCGNLTVPLDYKNASAGTVTLELLKWPAVHQPSRGSILTNPGGPGASGRVDLSITGAYLSPATGGHHDLISFDPRGVFNTIPLSCFNMTNPAEAKSKVIIGDRTLMAGNSSDAAMGSLWAATSLRAAACAKAPEAQARGNFTGTALVARDMMAIVDSLGEDGMLRYWGFSYGTLLGATVAAMFPDRIDKLILDGVVNPSDYYRAYEAERYVDTDATFRYFLDECVKLGVGCPLLTRRPNATADDLERLIRGKIQELKYHPVPVPEMSVTVDYSTVKSTIFFLLYIPETWTSLAALMDAIVTDPSDLAALLPSASTPPSDGSEESYAIHAIRCADRVPRHETLDEFAAAIEPTHQVSWLTGDTATGAYMTCARWPYHAAERYLGDFRVKTKNPVLVLSAELDPTTPLASARNVSAGLEGSVLLKRAGPGHCSYTLWSTCAYRATRDYFLHGRLPPADTTCEADLKALSSTEEYAAAQKKMIATLAQENAGNGTLSSA